MSPAQSSSRRAQRAQATAEQLLAAARQVFEERGYRATTVGAITEAAQTAHGTFYLYFKNKEDAFAKVFAAVVEELERESRARWQGDPQRTLHDGVAGYFGVVQRHRGLWKCLMEGIHQSPMIEQVWLDLRRPFVERLERSIASLAERGLARDLDPAAAAVALGSMVEWASFTVVELDEPAGVGADRVVDAITDLWLRGVYRDEALADLSGS